VRRERLPIPVQLPALVALASGRVLAIGGLGAEDSSLDTVIALAPGPPATIGHLPAAVHDVGAAAIGDAAYAFGGGTASGPVASITEIGPDGAARTAGRLREALSDAGAATIDGTAYVVGGYTVASHRVSVIGSLPRPLSHAAGASLNGTFFILGGRGDGLSEQRSTIWAVDPTTGAIRRAGRLPLALSDLGAASVGGRIVVAGGRDDAGRVHDELWTLAR